MELDERGGLVVVVPRHWSKRHINATLSQNISRVEQFLVRARKRQLSPLLYVQGELHLYLGTPYPLALGPATDHQAAVRFNGGEICIETRQNQTGEIQTALERWYRLQAQKVFTERMGIVAARAAFVQLARPSLGSRDLADMIECSSRTVQRLLSHPVPAALLRAVALQAGLREQLDQPTPASS